MFTLSKSNILRNKKEIENLYKSKNKIKGNFISLQFNTIKSNILEIKFLFIVPKRIFKKAVDRNRIKRILKETIRLNTENILYNIKIQKIHIQLYYNSNEIKKFNEINIEVIDILKKLNNII